MVFERCVEKRSTKPGSCRKSMGTYGNLWEPMGTWWFNMRVEMNWVYFQKPLHQAGPIRVWLGCWDDRRVFFPRLVSWKFFVCRESRIIRFLSLFQAMSSVHIWWFAILGAPPVIIPFNGIVHYKQYIPFMETTIYTIDRISASSRQVVPFCHPYSKCIPKCDNQAKIETSLSKTNQICLLYFTFITIIIANHYCYTHHNVARPNLDEDPNWLISRSIASPSSSDWQRIRRFSGPWHWSVPPRQHRKTYKNGP